MQKLVCLIVVQYFFRKKKSKSKNKERDERKTAEELVASASTSSSSKSNKNEVDAEKYYGNKTKSEIAFLKKKQESVRKNSYFKKTNGFCSKLYRLSNLRLLLMLTYLYRMKNVFVRKAVNLIKSELKNLMRILTVYQSITNRLRSPGQNRHPTIIFTVIWPWHHILVKQSNTSQTIAIYLIHQKILQLFLF